jgi:hypothetical protein
MVKNHAATHLLLLAFLCGLGVAFNVESIDHHAIIFVCGLR